MADRVLTVATGSADVASVRTEEFRGKTYTVVPVIAVVEGVLQGVNSDFPELAVASEFGKFPASWDGRPVMMNHPNINGMWVSASIHSVLETYQIGFLANTKLDGTKLKTEAWLDKDMVDAIGGDALETYQRVLDSEMVDVSVGAFIDIVNEDGAYDGKSYSGKWANVVPDHLAFLSAGVQGACTVEAGCGAPRINAGNTVFSGMRQVKPVACCDACAHGDQHCEGSDMSKATITVNSGDAGGVDIQGDVVVGGDSQASAPVVEAPAAADANKPNETTEELPAEAVEALRVERIAGAYAELGAYAAPSDMVFDDIRSALNAALYARFGNGGYCYDYYCTHVTSDHAVYYNYGDYNGYRYQYFQIAYTIDDNGNVTFTGEPEPVNVMTRIVPRDPSSGLSNNEGKTAMSGTSSTTEGQPAAAAPQQVSSFAELLAAAPAEIQEQMARQQKAYANQKAGLIKALTGSSRNKFSEEQLNAKTVDELEMLVELADVSPAPFAGRGMPMDADVSQVGSYAGGGNRGLAAYAEADTNFLGKSA